MTESLGKRDVSVSGSSPCQAQRAWGLGLWCPPVHSSSLIFSDNGEGRPVITLLLHRIQPTLVPQPKEKWSNKEKKNDIHLSLIKAFERTWHAVIARQIYYYNRTWVILMKSNLRNTGHYLWERSSVLPGEYSGAAVWGRTVRFGSAVASSPSGPEQRRWQQSWGRTPFQTWRDARPLRKLCFHAASGLWRHLRT